MSEETYLSADRQEQKQFAVSPRELILKYLPYLPLVIASVLVFLFLAFIKLRYSANVYTVTSTILVKDPTSLGSRPDKLEGMLFSQPNKNLNDEMQIIRSRSMAKRVVKSLGLDIKYFNLGKIRSTEIPNSENPFILKTIFLKDTSSPFELTILVLSDKEFSLVENGPPILFDQPFETNYGRFSLIRTINSFSAYGSNEFIVSYASYEQRAGELIAGLSTAQSGESNNILQLTYQTENTKIGADILNQWMREYQQSGLEDKRQIAGNTLSFIDDQMDTVKQELGGVEKNLLVFKEKNQVINPLQQSELYISSLSELDKELTQQGVKLEVINNLIQYISDNRNPYRKVASTLGIDEPTLILQVGEFNNLQVQRETLLRTTSPSNPMIRDIESNIEKLRQDIIQNLQNVKQAYQLNYNNIRGQSQAAGKEISQIPAKEKQMLDITRRQKILEELYSFLLQKKLETSIGSASTISNVRVIEPALPSGRPVLPNRQGTYTIAFILGLLIPSAIIFLFEFLNDKVRSREDIQRATNAPIIGEVGHAEDKNVLVVSKNTRRFISEQFRIIRTNLQYVIPKQEKSVILVTSSTSGEGKSFISTNIGAVMALAGKKTAIMEFDIRKPKIMTELNLPRKTGITNFIIGKSPYEDLAIPVPGVENLYVIPCGPVPPNPAELLLDRRLNELMDLLKAEYDCIIIDTAPIGLVSDSIMLGKYADVVLYIVRHNYTFKKQLQLLNEIYVNKKLPKLSVVINDIKAGGGYGRYYGYGGYGYTGYGYGYGTEYFDDKKPGGNFILRAKKFFRRD